MDFCVAGNASLPTWYAMESTTVLTVRMRVTLVVLSFNSRIILNLLITDFIRKISNKKCCEKL